MGPLTKTSLQRAAFMLLILAVLLILHGQASLPRYYFMSNDVFLAGAFIAVWIVSAYWVPKSLVPAIEPMPALIVAVGLALSLALWVGTYWIMFDYPLTRDEHMAVFDAATYADGKLAEPLKAEWLGFAEALAPAFLLDTPGHVLMVSGYLPLNAAARGVFGSLADPALMNPLLVSAGFVSLWWISRRLFADEPSAQWIALFGYLLSAQVLVNGMTAYAMTSHLALNLVWLALFLKDRFWSHALAMVVGVTAMGIHQFVFHPIFAAPFVLWLLVQKRWLHVAAYGLVYLAGVALWMSWPGIVMDWAGVTPAPGKEGGIGSFLTERILPLVTRLHPETVPLMAYNLVRGIGWNAVFLLPFLLAAGPAFRRREPVALALLVGLVLTILAMAILLPFQGHGWGYRYTHGLIGSLCLLAAFGYRELAVENSRWAGGAATAMAAVSLLIVLPVNIRSAHEFVSAHAMLSEKIDAIDADFVIVDEAAHRYAVDLVRNRADLSNRPLTFASSRLDAEQVATLCARGSVVVFGAEETVEAKLPGSINPEATWPGDPCGAPSPD